MKKKIKDINLEEFRSSTSGFRSEEMKALNINIKYTDDSSLVFDQGLKEIHDNHDILLPSFNSGTILSYVARIDDKLNTLQRRFLLKLKLVLLNNNPDFDTSSDKRYIDDLLMVLLDICGFDDGLELILRPCYLRLNVGKESFAAIADKEGRRGQEIAWLIQEDKHRKSSTFMHGDLQLACAIIAAAQQNYSLLQRIYPEKVLGIKVVADSFYFCSITMSEEYLEDLIDNLPKSSTTMFVYPKKGLKLSDLEERKSILICLETMKRYGLSLEKL